MPNWPIIEGSAVEKKVGSFQQKIIILTSNKAVRPMKRGQYTEQTQVLSQAHHFTYLG